MWKEFKEFAIKGNVVDLAVGVIIGGAFGKIVSSLVNDVLMPPLGLLVGKVDFSNLFISLSERHYRTLADAKNAGVATINYGIFLNNIVDFVIVAFAVFLFIKQMNKLRKQEAESPKEKPCPYCMLPIPVQATRCPNCTSQVTTPAL